MSNIRRRLVKSAVVVGLAVAIIPAWDAFGQNVSPFGSGNPLKDLQAQISSLITSLQTQINGLSSRLSSLENPTMPTQINGITRGSSSALALMLAHLQVSQSTRRPEH